MILVHSYKGNTDADFICNKLQEKELSFFRLNTEDELNDVNIYFENNQIIAELYVNDIVIKSSDITFFWYKGGTFNWSKYELASASKELNDQISTGDGDKGTNTRLEANSMALAIALICGAPSIKI